MFHIDCEIISVSSNRGLFTMVLIADKGVNIKVL